MTSDATPPNSSPSTPKLPPWLVIVLVVGFLGFAWYRNQQQQQAVERERAIAEQTAGQQAVGRRTAKEKPLVESAPPSSRDVTSADDGRDEPVVADVTPESGTSASRDDVPRSAAAAPTKTTVPEKPLTTTDRTPAPTRAGPGTATATRPATTNDRPPMDRTSPDPKMTPKSPTQPSNDPRRNTSPASNARNENGEKQPAATTTAQLENQTIRDFGKVVFQGTIDLQPTLDRIACGDRNTHRNDGTAFGNRERRLPPKPQGYYTEYVHPTKGINGPGPQRVIFGKSGDIWYTPDHYETFKKIK